MHRKQHGHKGAGQHHQHAELTNAPARQQTVCRHGAGVSIAVGVIDFVDQDQRQRNQTTLGQQQRSDQVGAGQCQHHQYTQRITPDIGQRVAQPGAAQRGAAAAAVARIVGHQRQP